MRHAGTLLWATGWAILSVAVPPSARAQDVTSPHRAPSCAPHPSARGYSHAVYDWPTGNVYIFGGIDEITPNLDYPLFDVWSYNIFTRHWKLRLTAPELYNAFQRDAVALDPGSRKVVLYSTFVNCTWDTDPWSCGVETWLYDLRSNSFENVTSGTEPPLRWGARMVYDAESRRAILFGGSDGYTSETLNDTWAFDFESQTWSERHPVASPPPHHFAAMAYQPRADRAILFGGYDIYADEVLDDTWAYDYNSDQWTEITPAVSPPPRMYHAMAWDAWSGKLVLFGGVAYPYQPVLGDTWTFDWPRKEWAPLAPRTSPNARAWQVMVGTHKGVLLFGGSPTHSPFTDDDTWILRLRPERWYEPQARHRAVRSAGCR